MDPLNQGCSGRKKQDAPLRNSMNGIQITRCVLQCIACYCIALCLILAIVKVQGINRKKGKVIRIKYTMHGGPTQSFQLPRRCAEPFTREKSSSRTAVNH